MLQKYFPVLGEVNSPLASLIALGFTAEAVKVAVTGVSNETLESLLWAEVEETSAHKAEIEEINLSQLEAVRKAAIKESRALRYRAAIAARSARRISKLSRKVKAAKRPTSTKATLRGLSGLSLETCRSRAATAQSAVRAAVAQFNTAHEAVEVAIEGGDVRAIRTCIAALKVAVRTLEVRHIEFKFAREMLSISLARHSA